MLQSIREHAQGWVIRIIIAIIVLAFTFWGIHGYFLGGRSATAVATVNGVQITKEQLAVAYERLRRQTQIQYGATRTFTTKDESILKLRALQTLTEIEALKQASIHDGFFVTDRQIDNYLESMPEFQVNGRFSTQRFQEVLSSTLLSTSDFFELIRTSLLIDQPRLGVLLSSFAVPEETQYTIALVNQERDFSYLSMPVQLFQATLAPISPEKIKAYYASNKTQFMTPEQVAVQYIEITLNDVAAKINPSDTTLKAAYNDNINSYTEPMSWRLSGIEIPVPQNAKPEAWDKALNEAKSFAPNLTDDSVLLLQQKKYPLSGSIGNEFLSLNKLPDSWQKTVASMQTAGQISAPFKTSTSVIVLKVIDVRKASTQSFEVAREKVKQTYIHQRAEEQFAALRDQLNELTYQHPDSLNFAAEKLGLPIKESTVFTKETGSGIASNKKVRDVAFSDEVLVTKNNSDVIAINAENAIVIHLKTHLKPTLLPLEAVQKQIEDKLKNKMLDASAKKVVNEELKALQSGKLSQAALSDQYKLKWNNVGYVGRYANKIDGAILESVFSLPRPNGKNTVIYGMTRLRNGNYILIALNGVKDGAIADEKQKAIFAEQVQNSEGLLEYELLKRSLLTHSKIEVMDAQ